MRFPTVIWFAAVAVLPQLTLAATPPGEVGALQAVFDFCTKADPKQHEAFDRQADALFHGLTHQQIAALRKTSEYQRGYQMLAGLLPGLRNNDAVEGCQAISGGHDARIGWVKRPHE